MKKLVQRAGVVALVAMALSIEAVGASTPCADFISSAGDDSPLTGYLVGQSEVTTTKTLSWSYTNYGGTFGGSSVTTETYSVGTYAMTDGSIIRLRCDGYVQV